MKSKLLAILCVLSLMGWSHAEEAASEKVAAITVEGTNTARYTTLEAALGDAETGQTITLLQNATLASATVISGKTLTIDLAKQTLTFSASITANLFSFTDGARVTFKNGTIDLSGVQTGANANFQVSGSSAQMTFEEVKLIGENYKSAYAVLYADKTCTGDHHAIALRNCTVELKNELSKDGGFLKADNTDAKFLISGCTIKLTNTVRGIILGDVTLENNSSLTITGEGTKTTLDNGINSSNLTVTNSTIYISNGSGRGLTLDQSNTVSIDDKSSVTISAMREGPVMFKKDITEGAKLTVEGTLTMDKDIVNESPSIDTSSVTVGSSDQIVKNSRVAQIGETIYASLAAAVAAVPANGTQTTIMLLPDRTGSGVVVAANKNIVFDLNGTTYTVTNPTVGSSGTETNGFQLLKGATVTFQNGTIESASAKTLIQNYCNLTLKDVTLNAQKNAQIRYALSNNCGQVTVTGATKIYASAGRVAFDLYYWPDGGYGEGVLVTFDADFTGQVEGTIEYAHDNTTTDKTCAEKACLTVAEGAQGRFDVTFSTSVEGANIQLKGGRYTSNPTTYCAKGYAAYEVTGDAATMWEVRPRVALLTSGEETTDYTSLEAAIAAAQSGDTITLLQDVVLTEKKSVLVVGKGTPEAPLTLDFNGHFVEGNNSSFTTTVSASAVSSGILAVAQSHVVLTDSSTGTKGGVRNTYPKPGSTTYYYAAVLVTTAYKDGTTTYADASAVIQGGIHLEVPAAGNTGCAVRQYHSETKGGTNKVEILNAETKISGVVVCKTEGAGATCEIKGGRFTSTCDSARTVAKDTHHTVGNENVYDIKVSGGEFTNHYVPQSDFPILSGAVVMDLTEDGQLHWTVGQPVPDAATMTVETLPSGYKSAEGVQIAVQGNAPFACLDAFSLFRSGVGVRVNETVEESCASLSFGAKAQMQTLEITVAQGKTLTFTEPLPLYRAKITVKGEGTFSVSSLVPQTTAYGLTRSEAAEGTTLYVCDVKDEALVATWTKADGSVNKYASVDDFVSFGTNAESTFKLYKDVEISLGISTSSKWNVSSGRKLTLDLNGHTLSLLSSSKGYHYILLNKGTLAITNSDTTRLGTLVSANTETAAIVVKGSTSATVTDYSVLSIGENVLVKGTSAVLIDRNSSSSAKNYGTKVSIAGALEGIDDAAGNPGSALYLNGNIVATTDAIPEVTLTSTARVSSSGVGIYAAGYAKWTVADGAQISGALSGIEIRAGQLTVNGGTIASTASSYSVEPNGSGTTTVGAGIAVAQHGTNLPLKVTITGGKISGFVALSEANPNPQGNEDEAINQVALDIRGGTFVAQSAAVVTEDCTGFVSGGNFSNAVPLAYCATGKVPKTLTAEDSGYQLNAPYTVVEPTSETFVAVKADGSAVVYESLATVPTDTQVYIAPSAEKNESVAGALSRATVTTGPKGELKDATVEVAEVLGGAFTVKQETNPETQETETKLSYHYNFGVAGLEVSAKDANGAQVLVLSVVAKLTDGDLPANRTLVGRTLQVVLKKGDGTGVETYSVDNPVFNEHGECRVAVPWKAMTHGTNAIRVKVVK